MGWISLLRSNETLQDEFLHYLQYFLHQISANPVLILRWDHREGLGTIEAPRFSSHQGKLCPTLTEQISSQDLESAPSCKPGADKCHRARPEWIRNVHLDLGPQPRHRSQLPLNVDGLWEKILWEFKIYLSGFSCLRESLQWSGLSSKPQGFSATGCCSSRLQSCARSGIFCRGTRVPWLSKPLMLLEIQQSKEIKVI